MFALPDYFSDSSCQLGPGFINVVIVLFFFGAIRSLVRFLLSFGRIHSFGGDHVNDPFTDVARVIGDALQVPGDQDVVDACGDLLRILHHVGEDSLKIVS